MRYLVRALDASQDVRTLVLEAMDEDDARAQALARSLTPLSVSRQFLAPSQPGFSLLLFAQELLALLVAGLTVVEALDALVEREPQGARRAVMGRLARDLRDGQRLSSALREQPGIFPPLFVGVVQAAEGTSDLPRALSRYLEYERRLEGVRHRVVSAAIYPAILFAVGLLVSAFLLGYVVPKFSLVYQGSGRPLPLASQLLLDWGAFAGRHAAALLVGAALALAAGWVWLRARILRDGWWRLLALLPGTRPRLRILELSRLYLTLGMLLEGGIPIQHALKLAGAVLVRDQLDAVAGVRADVQAGQPLSAAFERHGLSTPVALRLLRVGERSGQLGPMLTRTAAFYDEETARWIDRFTKAFEPVLMAAIGIVIGVIVILLYMPIFDLAGSLQ